MIPITTKDVIGNSIKMFRSLGNYKFNTMNVWCHRFLKRNGYTLRTKNTNGQTITSKFHKYYSNIYEKN